MPKPRSGNKLTGVERARQYHYAAAKKNREQLKLLLESGDDSLRGRARVQELQALVDRETEELKVVEQARELKLNFDDAVDARRQLSALQRDDRRKLIVDLIKANAIQGIAQLQMLLAEQGFRPNANTVSNDLKALNARKYRPSPNSPLKYVILASDPDTVTQEQLIEFALANGANFALQDIRRKGDRLYLSCTHRTAGHLGDVLQQRMLPDIVSILSDGQSTIWIELEDEAAARSLETMLRRYLLFGG